MAPTKRTADEAKIEDSSSAAVEFLMMMHYKTQLDAALDKITLLEHQNKKLKRQVVHEQATVRDLGEQTALQQLVIQDVSAQRDWMTAKTQVFQKRHQRFLQHHLRLKRYAYRVTNNIADYEALDNIVASELQLQHRYSNIHDLVLSALNPIIDDEETDTEPEDN